MFKLKGIHREGESRERQPATSQKSPELVCRRVEGPKDDVAIQFEKITIIRTEHPPPFPRFAVASAEAKGGIRGG